MSSIEGRISESAHDFTNLVCPKLREVGFLTGTVLPVETVTDSRMAKFLDMVAGIDLWIVEEQRGIAGLASRIQWGDAYNSFTIRLSRYTGAKTELHKRLQAINSNGEYLYPYWTCQAYITQRPERLADGTLESRGKLLAVAVAKTQDIITAIICQHCQVAPSNNRDASFAIVWWQVMQNLGFRVYTWSPSPQLVLEVC